MSRTLIKERTRFCFFVTMTYSNWYNTKIDSFGFHTRNGISGSKGTCGNRTIGCKWCIFRLDVKKSMMKGPFASLNGTGSFPFTLKGSVVGAKALETKPF